MKLGLLASAWLVGTIIGLRLDPAVLPLALLVLAAVAGVESWPVFAIGLCGRWCWPPLF